MKKNNSKETLASDIWGGLAVVQWRIDDVIQMGFQYLSEADKKPVSQKDSPLKKALYVAWWFVWRVGKSYYEKYEHIKSKKAKK